MEVRVVSTPSAGADNEPVHCYVAIELSKSSWIVRFQTPLTNKTSQYQVKACDANALLELIERIRTRVARELRRPIEVMSCYEAGYDGFWLHRVLKSHGIHNHVLDPASLQVNRRAPRGPPLHAPGRLPARRDLHICAPAFLAPHPLHAASDIAAGPPTDALSPMLSAAA